MRRAMFFYNPLAGQRRGLAAAERAAAVVREAGVEACVAATLSGDEAGRQAREAFSAGYDTIFACGGDGTIQDLAQGLVGSEAVLAVIPFGTANSLAHDVGIPCHAAGAARVALQGVPLRLAVGRVDCQSGHGALLSRYFLSVLGAGMDGFLFHQVGPLEKQAFGIFIYFWKALWLWLTHRMEWFTADVSARDAKQRLPVTEVLAVRLHDFGNLLRDLAPGASLLREDFRVVLFRTSSRLSYLLYILRGILGVEWKVPGIELYDAARIRLTPSGVKPVYLEADGELLGQLPAEISLLPNALTLLVPGEFAARVGRAADVFPS